MKEIIKFYTNWCGPCKVYGKTFDKIKDKYEGQLKFTEVNIETDTTGLAAKFNVRSIPHTVLIREDGSSTGKTGRLDIESLEELVLS